MALAALLALIPADADAEIAINAIRDAAASLSSDDLLASLGYTAEKNGRQVLVLDPGHEVVAILKAKEVASWAFRTAVANAHEVWIAANPSPFAVEEIEAPAPVEPEAEQLGFGF